MNIEYEATFVDVNKDAMREKLKIAGAELIKPEFLQKRVTFNFPNGHEINGGWIRVRDEGDQITMSVKIIDGGGIEDQKESCLVINDFNEGVEMLKTIGCVQKSYQETKRELWMLDGVEITIDEWPFLEPFVEVEGKSEECVKQVSRALGFEWKNAKFCAVGTLYAEKYNLLETVINNDTSKIVFGMQNPFVKK